MERNELKEMIRHKTLELDMAEESGKPNEQLIKIYKELKKLQYQLLQLELQKHHDRYMA